VAQAYSGAPKSKSPITNAKQQSKRKRRARVYRPAEYSRRGDRP